MKGSSRPAPVISTDWSTSITGGPGSIFTTAYQRPSLSVRPVETFGS